MLARLVPPPSLGLALTLASAACGSSVAIDDPPEPSSIGATGTSSNASATGSGGTASTSSTGGAGGSDGATTSASTGGTASVGEWRADLWIGQVDHIAIRHLDPVADICVMLQGTGPGAGSYDITMPEPWGIHSVQAWDATEGCMDDTYVPEGNSAAASTAEGTVTFTVPPMEFYPCELDADVTLHFDDPPAWLPSDVSYATTMLPVDGACP